MHKRLPYHLILFLAVLCIVPVPALPQVKGLTVSHTYDQANNKITLHVVNTSGKDVTAYNIKIKETYPTGINEHEYLTDTLGIMLNIQEYAGTSKGDEFRKQFGNGTLQAGASRDELQFVRPGLTNYETTVDTVIYADKTAETTNKEALDRALGRRKSEASTLQATNDIIKKALQNTQDPTPNETAAKEIEQVQRSWEAKYRHNPPDLNVGTLNGVMLELRNASNETGLFTSMHAYLNDYVTKKTQRAGVLLEHAAPKLGGAQ